MRQNKYSKLPRKSVRRLVPGEVPLVLHFKEANGRVQKIDLTFFNGGEFPRPQLAEACAVVFWTAMQNYASGTRAGLRINLKVFNNFLNWIAERNDSQQINTTDEITRELFIEYAAYLELINHDNKESTAAARYQSVAHFFRLMQEITNHLSPELKIPPNRFSHLQAEHDPVDNILSFKDVELIAEAAKKDIDEIRANNRRAQELIKEAASNDAQARMKPKPPGFWESVGNSLYYMIHVEDMTSVSEVTRNALTYNGHPPAMKMIGWYAPTSEQYFIPFLVLLYLRTAINVTSIFTLKRDCLTEPVLPLGLTTLNFTKPRAGAQPDKELYFPTNQPYGAIDLIRFLLEYTEPWLNYVSEAEKEFLFVYYSRMDGVRAAGNSFTQYSLSKFIADHNLPHFSFDQLRPTVATMLYLQTRDIFRVQRALNHKSIRTTMKYIKGVIVRARHDREMAKGIDVMVEAVIGVKHQGGVVSVFAEPMSEVIAAKVEAEELSPKAGEDIVSGRCTTLTGICIDPTNSPQPGEVKGRVCRSLHACIFCKNCWIFAEDLVKAIIYRNTLLAEKAEMTSRMWESLHGDAVREINESILPSFPAEMVAKAELEAKQMQASAFRNN
jgi:site-specific recombinase XerD